MMNNIRQPKVRIKKNKGFILPVALILLFIALSAGVVATKLSIQQSRTTGSALDSFVSLNYAKEVLTRCEIDVLNDAVNAQGNTRRQELTNIRQNNGGLQATSVLWQTWQQGSVERVTMMAANQNAFNSDLFQPTPVANIAQEFQAIMPATANGACLIEPLLNDRFVLTARAMTLSPFDMVQLQSFINFEPVGP